MSIRRSNVAAGALASAVMVGGVISDLGGGVIGAVGALRGVDANGLGATTGPSERPRDLSIAWAAARRATGTRGGEQET